MLVRSLHFIARVYTRTDVNDWSTKWARNIFLGECVLGCHVEAYVAMESTLMALDSRMFHVPDAQMEDVQPDTCVLTAHQLHLYVFKSLCLNTPPSSRAW